jgi:putative MATE family efflux protein
MHHFHLKHKPHKVDEKTRSEILNLPIWKLFTKLAIPAIFGMLMYAIYVFVDAIFVGQWVGKEGIAAISIVYPLTLVNSAIAAFMGMGFASVLSRAIGAEDDKTLKKILGNNTILVLIFSVIYTVIGLLFAENMVGALGATGTILSYGTTYFRIVVFGSFFINFIGSSIMLTLAEGKTKAAMSIIMAGSMLNIILDPIFIKVLGLGIEGAAIATVIAMVVTTILTLIYFITGDSELYFNKSGSHLDSKLLHEMAPVGASGMAMQLMLVIEQVIIFKSISIYGGGDDLAIIGATLNMLAFSLIPIWGISQGLQPVIGMNYGAKKYDRVKEGFKKFVIAATGMVFVIWALFMLFPQSVLSMYITDSKVASSGAPAFRIIMSMFFLHAIILLSATLFQAIGKGGMATFLLVARQVIIFAPIVIILPLFMGLDGVWISLPIADILILVITSVLVIHEFRILGQNPIKEIENKTNAGV